MRNVAEHARKDHGMEPTPELVQKVKSQIQTV